MKDTKLLKNLYYQMLRIRMVEEEIADRYKEGQMRCPTHLYIGQEGVACGVCANLRQQDTVVSYHRSHGHYLAKGGNLKKMIAELYGKVTGCSGGRGGSQHLIDLSVNFGGAIPIVGETIPLAAGMAWASKMKKEDALTAVFFGDAAVEEGVLAESLNFASLKKLPILFVCENNLYSICTPLVFRQPDRPIYAFASAFSMPAYQGDGNKVIEVYQMTKKAIEYIKEGKGPVFLEFLTYRYREHCGPNFEPEGWRPKREFDYWLKKDPVLTMEKHLIVNKLSGRQEMEKMKREIKKEIKEAFDFARKSPFPKNNPNISQVYA